MWHSFYLRLNYRWTRLPAMLRTAGLLVVVGLIAQGIVFRTAWRESQIRQQFSKKGKLSYGPSPLPPAVEQNLDRLVPHKRTELLKPVESAVIRGPKDDDFQSISALGGLKKLMIVDGQLTGDGLKEIRSLNLLESCYLQNDCTDATSLAGLVSCPKLSRLKLIGRLSPEALNPLARCLALTELHLDAGNVDYDEIFRERRRLTGPHLAAIARIPNLKRLVIHSIEIPDTEFRSLKGADQLEELFVESMAIHEDALNSLGRLPRLKRLVIEVSSARPAAVLHLSGFPALHTLALHGGSVPVDQIDGLQLLPLLETLSLDRCCVNKSLSKFSNLRFLRNLNLETTDLTPDGLWKLGQADQLEFINLPRTDFEGISEVKLREIFPRLKSNFPGFDWRGAIDFPNWYPPSTSVGGGFF